MADDTDKKHRKRVRHDLSNWVVTDDWPERVTVTDAEIAVFEAWFGDFFDELFSDAACDVALPAGSEPADDGEDSSPSKSQRRVAR